MTKDTEKILNVVKGWLTPILLSVVVFLVVKDRQNVYDQLEKAGLANKEVVLELKRINGFLSEFRQQSLVRFENHELRISTNEEFRKKYENKLK